MKSRPQVVLPHSESGGRDYKRGSSVSSTRAPPALVGTLMAKKKRRGNPAYAVCGVPGSIPGDRARVFDHSDTSFQMGRHLYVLGCDQPVRMALPVSFPTGTGHRISPVARLKAKVASGVERISVHPAMAVNGVL